MADKTGKMAVNAPRALNIKGQPHQLSYITPQEAGILRVLGGSGKPGPMGIPSFYDEGDDYTGPGGDSFADATGNQTTSISMEDLYSGPSFSSDDGDSGSVTGPVPRPPKTGLTKAQFENRFGITDRNPYGQTGFAKFFDKFSKALGGKGVDYRQQFRDLDRLMGRDPGDSLARFKQQQYGLYKDPKIAADGRIISGGIDQANRGTYQGPIEMVPRQMNLGEQLVRTGIGTVPFAGSFLSGLGTEDPYLASRVTPEMRERENPTLAEQLRSSLGLGDTIESIANKGSSLIERMQGIITGQRQQPAQAPVASGPAMGSMDPSREIGPLAQTIPAGLTNQDEVAAMAMMPAEMITAEGMPAESDQRLADNTTANMLSVPFPTAIPEDIAARRAPSTIESSFDDPLFDLPTPIGRRFDSPVTEIDTVSGPLDRYTIDTQTGRPMDEIDTVTSRPMDEIDTVTSRPMDEIDTVTSRPMDEIDTISFQSLFPSEVLDSIAAKPPELINAPNEGLGRDFGPRTPDDLRAIGIEPSVQDLIDMGLSPAEILQENLKRSKPQASTGQAQVAELDYPELSKLIELGRQLATGEDVGGSTKIFGGDLGVRFRPGDRGIGFQFRKELEDKDMGAREFLNFLNRITS